MKLLTTAALAATLAGLSGCAVYPVGPGGVYYEEQVYRGPPPVYYEPGPFYGPPPVYYRPGPVIIDRGSWDRDRRGDRDRYDRGSHGQRPDGARPPSPPPSPPPANAQPSGPDYLRSPGLRPWIHRND